MTRADSDSTDPSSSGTESAPSPDAHGVSTHSSKPYSKAYVLYAIGVIFFVSVFNVVDRYILSVLAPNIQADLALSDAQLGFLLGPSFSVVHFAAVLPAAWLADRYARRTVVAAGLLIWSSMTTLGAAASGFWPLFATRMGVGIGEAAGSPPSVALLSDTAPPEWRTRALSTITVGALFGVATGMIVGGYLGQHYSWRVALVAVGLPGVLLALLVRFTLREPPRTAESRVSPVDAGRHLFGLASFRWSVAGVCVANIAIAGRNLWEPTFLDRAYGLSGAALGGTYVLISALPSTVGALSGASVADRLARRDPRWLAWICGGSIGFGSPFLVGFLVWDPAHMISIGGVSFPFAFVLSALGSLFLGAFSPPMASLAQSLATPQMRSLAHAIWTMPYTLIGMGVGPMVIGSLSGYWAEAHGDDSLRRALVLTSVLLPLGAAGFLFAARTLREDISRVSTAHDD